MNSSSIAAMRHGSLVAFRFTLACTVAATLPLSHIWWSVDPSQAGVEGPAAFAFLLLFALVGAVVATTFFVFASFGHVLLRRQTQLVPWMDAGVAHLH